MNIILNSLFYDVPVGAVGKKPLVINESTTAQRENVCHKVTYVLEFDNEYILVSSRHLCNTRLFGGKGKVMK